MTDVDRFIRRHEPDLLIAAIAAVVIALVIALAAWGQDGADKSRGSGATAPGRSEAKMVPSNPGPAPAASAPSAALTPTETQSLKLHNAQLEARLAFMQAQDLQRQAQEAQGKAQASLKALLDLADEVKRENKWPADTGFDASTVAFTKATPKTPEKPTTSTEKPK